MGESGGAPELTGSIERTLRALQAVAELGDFTPKDIASEVGVPTSTAYRLVQSLGAMNFVEKSSHGRYRAGRHLLRLASLIVDKFDYEVIAHPFLVDLVNRFDETAAFAIYLPNDYAFTIIDSISANHPLQYVVVKYQPRAMVWGALGRAMLPFLPRDAVEQALARQGPPHEPGAEPMTMERLTAEFEAIHKTGCFVATSPNALGTTGTAAPVFNSRGQLLGSLGVAVPVVRYDPAIQDEISRAVVEAARGLSDALGFADGTTGSSRFAG